MNMRKEYREELRLLNRSDRKLRSDLIKQLADLGRQTRQIMLAENKARRSTTKQLQRIDRRRAILLGRLAS